MRANGRCRRTARPLGAGKTGLGHFCGCTPSLRAAGERDGPGCSFTAPYSRERSARDRLVGSADARRSLPAVLRNRTRRANAECAAFGAPLRDAGRPCGALSTCLDAAPTEAWWARGAVPGLRRSVSARPHPNPACTFRCALGSPSMLTQSLGSFSTRACTVPRVGGPSRRGRRRRRAIATCARPAYASRTVRRGVASRPSRAWR